MRFYDALDTSPIIRRFAERFIYEKPKHADFFVTQFLFISNFVPLFGLMFYWQITYNELPSWLLIVYNFGWVSIGARGVGAAYFMAHREGHVSKLYRPWLRKLGGNLFENFLGLFYGSVPWNFTTTHVALHHRLDAGAGDTLYCWDIDRSSWPDFCMYQARGLLHMSGFGALIQFWTSREQLGHRKHFWLLSRGVFTYWVLLPLTLLWITKSWFFYFWVVLQPLLCMSWFLALINMGFHAFIENDADGLRNPTVQSITFLGGSDDFFGEDDHMAHHNQTHVYWRDLRELQQTKHAEWAKHKSSVFQGYDIFTFSVTILLKAWPLLADRFVDASMSLTKPDIAKLLESRVTRRERQHTEWLPRVPRVRCKNHPQGPEPEAPRGSAVFKQLHRHLAALQLQVARVMDMGMPPIRAIADVLDESNDVPDVGSSEPALKKLKSK
eukprot:CAMPEP_0169252294 /NCGR_PEP_ID=MMETSP1016-20121227/37974_1 /TAXON_ID=342587 /ORGANISM="Karlodinium micrum, Strain CCMP2283" /LENGTH=439 /DNA_ID=CAMNT_0009333497 /DNA_START=215 /DNA_END=1534 /DNA_ORIENTATION=+